MTGVDAQPPDDGPASSHRIDRVGVIGAGLMGSGIAELCARRGLQVVACENSESASAQGAERIDRSLQRAVRKGKLDSNAAHTAQDLIFHGTDLQMLADCDLVVEAVAEDENVKTAVFREVSSVMRPDAILASNTSSIPIMKLATATERPNQVIGLHFFNPVPVLDLVEVVPSLVTDPEVERRIEEFATKTLGKTVIRSQDRAGFIVNALLVPFLLAAIRMTESGFASVDDIDNGMRLGCAHPMGPLQLVDLIGLDTLASVAKAMYEEFKEPLYAAPPVLLRMVEAGMLGRKSGRGFHTYP